MPLAERTRAPVIGVEQSLWGWGRVVRSRSRVFRPRDLEDVVEIVGKRARPDAGVIARGAGRSYGDAAQNEGGDVIDMTAYDRILSIDSEGRRVTVQAGA